MASQDGEAETGDINPTPMFQMYNPVSLSGIGSRWLLVGRFLDLFIRTSSSFASIYLLVGRKQPDGL